MKSRTITILFFNLIICFIIFDNCYAENESIPSVDRSPEIDENKIFLECKNPDYKTYIKCLKRHKRHHPHIDKDTDWGDTNKCYRECEKEHCVGSGCENDCFKHCMKKTKETRIIEYETVCESSDCEGKKKIDQATPNITTNIELNNVIHNHIPKNEVPTVGTGGGGGGGGTGGSGGNGKPNTPVGGGGGGGGGGGTPNVPTNGWYRPQFPGWFGGGLTLIPQIQLVPQITFGLGFNSFGGGGFYQGGGNDCSSCSNPFLRYRCDVNCYQVQGTNTINENTIRTTNVAGGCTSPQCVGGN